MLFITTHRLPDELAVQGWRQQLDKGINITAQLRALLDDHARHIHAEQVADRDGAQAFGEVGRYVFKSQSIEKVPEHIREGLPGKH